MYGGGGGGAKRSVRGDRGERGERKGGGVHRRRAETARSFAVLSVSGWVCRRERKRSGS